MTQMTLSDGDRIACVFGGARCKYLKQTSSTGMAIPDHNGRTLMIMGYCRYLGGDAYDASCKGCTAYIPAERRRC